MVCMPCRDSTCSTKWSLPLLYALILLFIVLRPNGLFGKKIVKKV